MERFKRSLFFWSLVLIFFTITPVVILEARGYRFDWHRGVFVYSGTISFKVNPQNITASLNGTTSQSTQLNRINGSFNIAGLLPMDYSIIISANGYHPWNKKIDVHSGVSSEFWNVVLTRENYARTDYNQTNGIDKFFTSPKNRSVAFTVLSDRGLAVKVIDLGDKSLTASFDLTGQRFIPDERKENIEWSPEENYLSVPVEKIPAAEETTPSEPVPSATYFILDLNTKQTTDISSFFNKQSIRYVRWDPKNKGYLFFLDGTTLLRGNINDAASLTTIAENVSAYDLSYDAIYYVQNSNDLVFKTSLDGQAERTQVTDSFPDSSDPTIARITVYDESRIAFLSDNGRLFIFNDGDHDEHFHQIGDRIEEMHFSNDGKKLLFYTTNEISVYFTRDWTVQPFRSEDDTQNITRYSETLKNVQWYKDYEHVIFSVGPYTKIIELDPRDHRNCLDLISTDLQTPFVIHDNGLEKLFFTDNKDGSTVLESINFPEPTPILGIGGA